ncbi:hypothetical protein [Pseudomonas fluorescens]|uniref:Novel STAND NTPase 3 domain-containing protein n=1 Tax=Pseudomonas fluorescens TaxID=294 RepID=A0A5E7CDH0_PSEFL|nr:hypothetical protein [Pseudomonas fluorescens]VVO02797.1 hypothetical protein PS833_02796 [Pseudomonas fluorescens]
MTIAITAPEKFNFQDLACLEMMLRFENKTQANFYVEPLGGEDGEIRFDGTATGRRVEIQIKGSELPVKLSDIAKYLAHCPPRKSNGTLLERLLDDPELTVLFIVSGRCDDQAALYSVAPDWLGASHGKPIKVTDAQAFIDVWSSCSSPHEDDKDLAIKRKNHCLTLAGKLSTSEIRDAFQRMIILERVSNNSLLASCSEYLRRSWRIPDDRVEHVILELREIVSASKSLTHLIDSFPKVRDFLNTIAPMSIRPTDYVARGQEQAWFTHLSRQSVLLLSGLPRVGKTSSARWVAAEFEQLGYEVRRYSDIDEAERFLSQPGTANRLVVLDDPLGGTHSVVEPVRALRRLEQLVVELTRGTRRKLIVAQVENHLLTASRKANLSLLKTSGHQWWDLGQSGSLFKGQLWSQFASTEQVPEPIRSYVQNAVDQGTLDLEPGCLLHLASHHYEYEGGCDLDNLYRFARVDAASLGHALTEQGFGSILLGMSVASSVSEPISSQMLSVLVDKQNEESETAILAAGSVFDELFGVPLEQLAMPSIPPDRDKEEKLAALASKRIIEVVAQKNIAFSHTFYRSAAEASLDDVNFFNVDRITKVIAQGLFCWIPSTSRATARNLDWVFQSLAQLPEARLQIVGYAERGLKSVFPSTRDLCFNFLLRHLSVLPTDVGDRLPNWVSAVSYLSLDDMEWRNGEARLSDEAGQGFRNLGSWGAKTPLGEGELDLWEAKDSPLPTPEQAARVLNYYEDNLETMTLGSIGRLLSFNEAVIRAKAVELWLQFTRTDDDDVILRIFREDHPLVALAALKGTVKGWNQWTEPRRTLILEGLARQVGVPSAATVVIAKLLLFGRVEHTGKQTPWRIFARLLPIALSSLPHNAPIVDARLHDVCVQSTKYLQPAEMVAICDAWTGWLKRMLHDQRMPADFALGVVEILMQATITHPELRKSRIAHLLAFKDTGAVLAFTADLIRHVEQLTDDEYQKLLKICLEPRPDSRWISAALLMLSQTPSSVLHRILPLGLTLDSSPKQLVEQLPLTLLEAVMDIFYGVKGPLGQLGIGRVNSHIWLPVFELIASLPEHALFNDVWEHLASEGWHETDQAVTRLIRANATSDSERILDILIRVTSRSGNPLPQSWKLLLGRASDPETRERWLKKVLVLGPLILRDLSELDDWLVEEQDQRGFWEVYREDRDLLKFTAALKEGVPGIDLHDPHLATILEICIGKWNGHFADTYSILQRRLTTLGITSPELLALLEQRRHQAIHNATQLHTQTYAPWPPIDWIGP